MTTETAAKPKLLTAEEFCDWVHRPENADKWFELVRGMVIELPPPQRPHGVVSANVARIVGNYVFERRMGYLTTTDSGVILERDPDTVRGPDIALYDDARTFAELHPKYGEVPPIMAVEVLSPNDRADRVTRKITDYLRTGVRLVWLVDPEARTVTVYKADTGPRLVEASEELDGGELLPGFRCHVADIFLLPGESPEPQPEPKPEPPRKRRRR
jgi:Uma2 family endonuclease